MKTHLLLCLLLFSKQGSTLRKRKMYEEFLSKVSILGQWPQPCMRLCAVWPPPVSSESCLLTPVISTFPACLAGSVLLLMCKFGTCTCMYPHRHALTHVCTPIGMLTHVYTHTDMLTHMYVSPQACSHMYVPTQAHIHMYAPTQTRSHTYAHTPQELCVCSPRPP